VHIAELIPRAGSRGTLARVSKVNPKFVGELIGARLGPGVRKHSVAWFLGALVALYITAPFMESMKLGPFVESIAFTFVLSSAVLAVGGRKRVLIVAIVLVIPTLLLRWGSHPQTNFLAPEAFMVGALVFTVFVTANLLGFVLKAPRVNSEVLCAGIAVYLLLALTWAFMYMLAQQLNPHSFTCTVGTGANDTMTGFNVLYFSLVSMNGAAFGDFMPLSPATRMLAMLQTTVGLFYIAVMVARLVSLYAPLEPQKDA